MQQRYYDPIAGRFLSMDPISSDADTGDKFDRYAYANNNPYRYTDPDGRDSWGKEPPPPPPPQELPPVKVVGKREPPNTSGVAPTIPTLQLPTITITAARIAPLVRPAIWMWLFTPMTLGDDSCEKPGACGIRSQGQRPSKTPNTGIPGSTIVNPGSGQERTYGPDGRPLRDVDHDHDHGQGVPHQHDWVDGVRGPGVPVPPPEQP
jgi:uncharacterized protein RhaS with RHS repeats